MSPDRKWFRVNTLLEVFFRKLNNGRGVNASAVIITAKGFFLLSHHRHHRHHLLLPSVPV